MPDDTPAAATGAPGAGAPATPAPAAPAEVVAPPTPATPPAPADSAGAPPKAAEEARLAPRFAELAKREREWTAKQSEWKPKVEAAERFEAARKAAAENPLAALEILGVPFQALVDAQIRAGRPETVEEKVERLEKERAAEKKAAEEAGKQAAAREHEQVITAFKGEVTKFVDSAPDDYELVIARKAHGLVFEVIEEHFKSTGKLLPMNDAAKMVEDHLFEEAQAMLKSKKLGAAAPAAPATHAPAAKGAPAAAPPSMSIAATKGTPAPPEEAPKHETHDARIARIAAGIAAKKAAAGNART